MAFFNVEEAEMNESAPAETLGFLKNIRTGAVFRHTDILASRKDMLPCDARGTVAAATQVDAERQRVGEHRPVTKYLGNPNNGELLNYSPIIAERAEMVSVNTFQEWEAWKRMNMQKAQQKPNTVAPSLSRMPPADLNLGGMVPTGTKLNDPVVDVQSDPPANKEETGAGAVMPPIDSLTLPSIEGLGAREAKTVLSDWAKEHFGRPINRRPGLPEVIAECESLITNGATMANAG